VTETEIVAVAFGQTCRVGPGMPSLHVYVYGWTPPRTTACKSMQSPAQFKVALVRIMWAEFSISTEKSAPPPSNGKL
jgi:hypothetical protein